ncbi:MAG: hypothetical protein IPP68_04230 [Elusimicrobia bacterium]|nr:hypothetical protein [Elusimicrobiota bacterium]
MTGRAARSRGFRRAFARGGAVLLLAVPFLSGCVYLRLLEIKKQLRNFDENFYISGRSELIIGFNVPVLKTKDVKFLIGAEPLYQTAEGEDVYHYEFEESPAPVVPAPVVFGTTTFVLNESTVPAAGPPPLARLSLDLAFHEGKLVKIIVPETFMLLFPRNVLVETLKQAANAEVFETKRLARGRISLPPHIEAELPSLSKTLFLLGEPATSYPEGDLQTFVYNFRIAKEDRRVPIQGRLCFDARGLLRRVFVRWDISSVEADFPRE